MSHHHHGHACSDACEHGDDEELGIQYSLYQKIDLHQVECLNEAVDGSGKSVFKPWENRLTIDKFVESDVDEELLFNIPFTGLVKLKGIIVIGGNDDSHPAAMRLFKNRPHMTFDDVQIPADQEFEMTHDPNGTLEYATKVVKFSSVHHLSVHFSRNFGSDSSKVYYIGLKGEYSEMPRQGVTICTYEAAPNPADHKLEQLHRASHEIQ